MPFALTLHFTTCVFPLPLSFTSLPRPSIPLLFLVLPIVSIPSSTAYFYVARNSLRPPFHLFRCTATLIQVPHNVERFAFFVLTSRYPIASNSKHSSRLHTTATNLPPNNSPPFPHTVPFLPLLSLAPLMANPNGFAEQQKWHAHMTREERVRICRHIFSKLACMFHFFCFSAYCLCSSSFVPQLLWAMPPVGKEFGCMAVLLISNHHHFLTFFCTPYLECLLEIKFASSLLCSVLPQRT